MINLNGVLVSVTIPIVNWMGKLANSSGNLSSMFLYNRMLNHVTIQNMT